MVGYVAISSLRLAFVYLTYVIQRDYRNLDLLYN